MASFTILYQRKKAVLVKPPIFFVDFRSFFFLFLSRPTSERRSRLWGLQRLLQKPSTSIASEVEVSLFFWKYLEILIESQLGQAGPQGFRNCGYSCPFIIILIPKCWYASKNCGLKNPTHAYAAIFVGSILVCYLLPYTWLIDCKE